MSIIDMVLTRDRYSSAIPKRSNIQIMSTNKDCDVIPLFPEKDEDSAATGWDPYIFSILTDSQKSHIEERRRVPRPLTAARRRALLISGQWKDKKDKK
jgi:hypothetical protein